MLCKVAFSDRMRVRAVADYGEFATDYVLANGIGSLRHLEDN